MTSLKSIIRSNAMFARHRWGKLSPCALSRLKELSSKFKFLVSTGDITFLDGGWYVTHTGLLGLARRRRCSGIQVTTVTEFSDPASARWVFKAVVYTSRYSKGFVGYGDADPSNVSFLVNGAEMRVAETRAVNRALRKAYGIGLCSVEELGSVSGPPKPFDDRGQQTKRHSSNGSNNGQPRLRDRLCLLIRQHSLDPSQVKQYAADFCGTESLKDASKELVESFVSHIADWAKQDRDGLVCKLNSYAQPQEAHS